MGASKDPSRAIARSNERARLASEELLYWSTEVLRAEESGDVSSSLLQATQSASALASAEQKFLRALLDHDISDEQAEQIYILDEQFARLADQYQRLVVRAQSARDHETEIMHPPQTKA